MTEKSDDLRQMADALQDVRQERHFPPRWDGKLAEAEINIRGVADALEARRP